MPSINFCLVAVDSDHGDHGALLFSLTFCRQTRFWCHRECGRRVHPRAADSEGRRTEAPELDGAISERSFDQPTRSLLRGSSLTTPN